MNSKPLVSVFMPAYQQEKFISDSIESVIGQSFEDWELVIGDDSSQDRTFEIALEYQRKFPDKIKAFKNGKNIGITANFNRILDLCVGKYIAIMAADDILLPEKLEKQVALMEENPDCVLSYHDVEVFESESNSLIRYWNSGPLSTAPAVGPAIEVAKMLVLRGTGFMSALSVMAKREAIPESGFDFRIPVASDWLMWIEICANSAGMVHHLDSVLARYRKHSGSITHMTQGDTTDDMVTLGLVEARYPWLREYARRRRGYEFYRHGVSLILSGDFPEGRRQLLLGMRTYVWSIKSIGWLALSILKQVLSKN